MQVSRHWRLNSQRYRLEGVRYNNDQVSLQQRPVAKPQDAQDDDMTVEAISTMESNHLQKVVS